MTLKFCSECGEQVPAGASFCPKCGHAFGPTSEEVAAPTSRPGSGGNVVAALASLIIPGLGQLAQGRILAGFGFAFFALMLWLVLLGWIIHIFAAIEAARFYDTGKPTLRDRLEKVSDRLEKRGGISEREIPWVAVMVVLAMLAMMFLS